MLFNGYTEDPIADSARLQPLHSAKALRREGREMHNCVAGYDRSVVQGQHYFFAWRPEHGARATVQLRLERGQGWVLKEYLGYANTRLDGSRSSTGRFGTRDCPCCSPDAAKRCPERCPEPAEGPVEGRNPGYRDC